MSFRIDSSPDAPRAAIVGAGASWRDPGPGPEPDPDSDRCIRQAESNPAARQAGKVWTEDGRMSVFTIIDGAVFTVFDGL